MRHSFSLLLVFLFCLLATACSGSFSQAGLTGPTSTPSSFRNGLRVLLVPMTGTDTPTQEALNATRTTLVLRLAAFGLPDARVQELTSGNQPTLQIELPHFGGDERAALDVLLGTGRLDFWDTGFIFEHIGTTFDSTQFTRYNPGNQPWFTGNDLDTSHIRVGTDPIGRPEITFQMKGEAIARFSQFTASHADEFLTLTLDSKVIESALIQSRITGPAVITGPFTRQQARAIASVLKYPSLPLALQIGSESPF